MTDTGFKSVTLVVAVGTALVSCARLTKSELTFNNLIVISKPFAGYSPSSAEIFSSSVTSAGAALISSRYNLNAHGDSFGVIDYANGAVDIHRSDIPGPCTDGAPAPSCGFTWGSGSTGVYHGGDYNYFPNSPSLSKEFRLIKYIQVDVHHELATGNLGSGISDCGIDLGFGSGVGAPNAPMASTNLQIAGRTTNTDMVKFMHRYTGTTEKMMIEAPLNLATDSGFTAWDLSVWDSSFNMTKDSIPAVNGDYVDFRMSLLFDHVAKTVTITTTPLATNKDLFLMHEQTVIWPYTADDSHTEGGEARGGLTIGAGAHPISVEDLERARASVGFIANGVAKSCRYSNIALGLLKEPEGSSTP